MEQNTGNKLATQVVITKRLGGNSQEILYPVGRYENGNFTALTPEVLSRMSDSEYMACVADTRAYIAGKEGIENIEEIFTNEPLTEDLNMCPLNFLDTYGFAAGVEDHGNSWEGSGPKDIDVAFTLTCPNKPIPALSKYIVIELKRNDNITSYWAKFMRDLIPEKIYRVSFGVDSFPVKSKVVHVGEPVSTTTPDQFNMKDSDEEYDYKVSPAIVEFIPQKPDFVINGEFKVEGGKIYTRVTSEQPVKSNIKILISSTSSPGKSFELAANSTTSDWIFCRDDSQSESISVNIGLEEVNGAKTRFDDFYRYRILNRMWNNGK